jgi:aspartate aminotransferase-like enzyme
MISGGLTPTLGKAIRIGLMGKSASDEMVDRLLELVRESLAA